MDGTWKTRRAAAGPWLAWALAAGSGFAALATREATPGRPGSAVGGWPAGSSVAPDPRRPTLLIFLHPRCPCSRASLAELTRLEARCRGRFAASAFVYRPAGLRAEQAREWAPDPLAGSIPGLRLVDDPGGRESRRFGAETSGHVMLYAADGRLLYSGGITRARGVEGGNAGAGALAALILGGAAPDSGEQVYGCPIF